MTAKKMLAYVLTASILVLPVPFSSAQAAGVVSSKYVSITDYGAVPNDANDDLPAIRQAAAAAKAAGKSVYVPPGTFLYSDAIVLDGVDLTGEGEVSVLKSTNAQRQAVQLGGSGSDLSRVKLTTIPVSARLSSSVSARVHVTDGASNYSVKDTIIEGGSSAGIIAYGVNGTITGNTIRDTLADGIHITGVSANIRVENNTLRSTGDDMIAVVSYEKNGDWVKNVKISGNDMSGGHARGITVSGGMNVQIEDNRIADTGGAGIFIASEGSYKTYAVTNLKVVRNTVARDSLNPSIPEKGGIRVQATYKEPSIVNAQFAQNTIKDSADSGILILGSASIVNASFEQNQILRPAVHGIYILKTVVGTLRFAQNAVVQPGGSVFYNSSKARVTSDLPNSAPEDNGGTDAYTAARGTPFIDGAVDDVWLNATPLKLNVDANGTTGTVRVAWDDSALYYLFEMTDRTPYALASEEHNDSVEVWTDELNAKNGTRTTGDYQLRVDLNNKISSVVQGFNLSKVRSAVVRGDGTYTAEFAVPYVALTPKAGDVIGFNASANDDANGDGKRDTYLSWIDKNLPYWADTRVYGEIVLGD
ncbi:sugar-binding protein [Saccharibacillus sp. CPCC 101409]|uniref:sugar-binding protein n=1 Tax=Saccharibacillus sp. CPCC 101409 TaxID=3058041 RepID=UPI0026715364|nr:sugar-binding protein [Saccharibacillus sp. CPCC 101409]MDO3410966.1 sugar-binding protein [Saccharibacillus sp. CPCC 101409]